MKTRIMLILLLAVVHIAGCCMYGNSAKEEDEVSVYNTDDVILCTEIMENAMFFVAQQCENQPMDPDGESFLENVLNKIFAENMKRLDPWGGDFRFDTSLVITKIRTKIPDGIVIAEYYVTLRSAGEDRNWGTDDDIIGEFRFYPGYMAALFTCPSGRGFGWTRHYQ